MLGLKRKFLYAPGEAHFHTFQNGDQVNFKPFDVEVKSRDTVMHPGGTRVIKAATEDDFKKALAENPDLVDQIETLSAQSEETVNAALERNKERRTLISKPASSNAGSNSSTNTNKQ